LPKRGKRKGQLLKIYFLPQDLIFINWRIILVSLFIEQAQTKIKISARRPFQPNYPLLVIEREVNINMFKNGRRAHHLVRFQAGSHPTVLNEN
jgi:hypothetical protein